MYRAIVFNVIGLQEFEGFRSSQGYVESKSENPGEAALSAVRAGIGDVDEVDVYLVHDVIFAYEMPCGCVYEDNAEPIKLKTND